MTSATSHSYGNLKSIYFQRREKKLDALRSAMGDIQTLSVNPQLTWAYDWFLQLGHDETNPDTLMMFIQMFSVGTQALRKLLKETIPR